MHVHLANAVESTARPRGPTPAGMVGHDVQFYQTESFLMRVVADYLAAGVRAGQPLVVIARESHRRLFSRRIAKATP